MKAENLHLKFQELVLLAPAKGEAPDDLHHYQSHSHRIKSVGAVIICCLLQQKPQQITKKKLVFLQLKGNQKLGMKK